MDGTYILKNVFLNAILNAIFIHLTKICENKKCSNPYKIRI
ncbi:hypothetical protein EfmU0317_0109 [Enterococcus faecium U0317]|nr:hypothetical protein EfmU0317_0109 [Enterococcus faecium U0317]